MRIVHFEKDGVPGIAADNGPGWHGLTERESGFPGTLLPRTDCASSGDLLRTGRDLLSTHAIDLNTVLRILPPVPQAAENPLCRVSTTMITSRKAGSKSRSTPETFRAVRDRA